MALVRAQGIEGNETGQEASVRAEVAGTGAQCSGWRVSLRGGKKMDKGKQAFPEVKQYGQNSRQRLRKRTWIKG